MSHKIFIYLPNWLGDSVMASAAVFELSKNYPNSYVVFYGNKISCEIFKSFSEYFFKCEFVYEDKKRRFKQFMGFKKFDLAISFKGSLSAKICFFLLSSKKKLIFNKNAIKTHQVVKYANLITPICKNIDLNNLKLFLPFSKNKDDFGEKLKKESGDRKLFGINPGASYGSAKRWDEKHFADVAKEYANTHQIIIFGVLNENEICQKIEKILKNQNINVINLCGKTSIKELCECIKALDLFVTNDSGPMHIGAAYGVKMVAIFGPTKTHETSPFSPNAKIVKLNLECMPCMKRVCPLGHHKCMKNLTPNIVLNTLKTIEI